MSCASLTSAGRAGIVGISVAVRKHDVAVLKNTSTAARSINGVPRGADARPAGSAAATLRSSSSALSRARVNTTTRASGQPLGHPTGYPGRTRFSLMMDQYSRIAIPDNSGAEEVQKRPISDIFWGAGMCFFTMCLLGLADVYVSANTAYPFLVAAWGTMCVLAFGMMDAPVIRIYNLTFSTLAASFIAVAIITMFGACWWTRSLALAVSLAFMMWTGSVHPPAAACVMVAMENVRFQSLGFWYILYPTVFGSLFIVTMGKVTTYLKRKYPFTLDQLLRREKPAPPPPPAACEETESCVF